MRAVGFLSGKTFSHSFIIETLKLFTMYSKIREISELKARIKKEKIFYRETLTSVG
jgi:hypothetical protein